MREELEQELRSWRSAGLERCPEPSTADPARDFTSNDYLGFSRRPELIEAARQALLEYGVGGRAARLLGGGSILAQTLERRAAEWLGADATLAFPSGYQANLGVLTTLAGPGDVILSDELNHASLIDAARMSGATIRVFRHLDQEHLAWLARNERAAHRRLIVTEGVFSMDGDSPDLCQLNELALRENAWIVIDEAHSAGLIGPAGTGAWARDIGPATGDKTTHRLAARILTGGKALGVCGGIVAADEALIRLLHHRARSFVFTTAMSPAVTAALIAAIELVPSAGDERERALGFATRFARELGLPQPGAAIVPVILGGNDVVRESEQELQRNGLDVRAVRPPTVPVGSARLRIAFHSTNSEEAVDELLQALDSAPQAPPQSPGGLTRGCAPICILGTDTDVGKTVVSALLARAAARRGPSSYWKPVQSGLENGRGDREEIERLTQDVDVQLCEPSYVFEYPASPHESAARESREIDTDVLDREFERLKASSTGALLFELAGGLLVPLTPTFTQADWLARHDFETVLVARAGLGTLNHTLLTLEALRARRIIPRALFLVGEEHPSNRDTLASVTKLPILELPLFPELEAGSLDVWLDAHDLDFLFH